MSWKRPTELEGVAFGIHPICLRFIAGVNMLGGRKGWRMSENADISEAERIRLCPYTDLSPYRCASGKPGWITAATEVPVHDHERSLVSELAGRALLVLLSSLIKYPAVITVALVYLERDRNRCTLTKRVHAHGCHRLTLEKGGLMSFHERYPGKSRE
jgi:hypothetical protein